MVSHEQVMERGVDHALHQIKNIGDYHAPKSEKRHVCISHECNDSGRPRLALSSPEERPSASLTEVKDAVATVASPTEEIKINESRGEWGGGGLLLGDCSVSWWGRN